MTDESATRAARAELGEMTLTVHNIHRVLRTLGRVAENADEPTLAERATRATLSVAALLTELYRVNGIAELFPDPRTVEPGLVGYTKRELAEMEARHG